MLCFIFNTWSRFLFVPFGHPRSQLTGGAEKCTHVDNSTLTFCAVISLGVGRVLLVAFKTDLFPVGPAGVVSELVVSRSAQGVAVCPVVVAGAHHPVLVLELGVGVLVHALGPVLAGIQLLLGGHATYQSICNPEKEHFNSHGLY